MDCYDKKDLRADQLNKGDMKDVDTISGKYISKNRRAASKLFEKKIAAWCWYHDLKDALLSANKDNF